MAENQNDSTEKTLDPTPKKLQAARKKGDVPSSRETGNMTVILALLGVTVVVLPWQLPAIVSALWATIEKAGEIVIAPGQPGIVQAGSVMSDVSMMLARSIAPIFLVFIVGAILGTVIQGQTVIAFERIQPKLSKVSLREGFKRLFSLNSLVELAKSLVKVFVVGALALWISYSAVQSIWQTTGFLPEYLLGYIADAARQQLIAEAIFVVPVAIADILWRRFEWMKKQRMSHKDLKDEQKESEGSPEVRAKRARQRMDLSHQRTVSIVPQATLVLTNPTHYAVALQYDPDVDLAPRCVAKGADNVARRIREIAFEHEVPVIENKPLARLLYDTVELEDIVPVEHWEIVAEIVSYVFDLQKNVKRKPPSGSMLRTE